MAGQARKIRTCGNFDLACQLFLLLSELLTRTSAFFFGTFPDVTIALRSPSNRSPVTDLETTVCVELQVKQPESSFRVTFNGTAGPKNPSTYNESIIVWNRRGEVAIRKTSKKLKGLTRLNAA